MIHLATTWTRALAIAARIGLSGQGDAVWGERAKIWRAEHDPEGPTPGPPCAEEDASVGTNGEEDTI